MMAQKTHESDIERIAVFGVCEREREERWCLRGRWAGVWGFRASAAQRSAEPKCGG